MLTDLIRERGPLTVAAFMEFALYHPTLGYYARAAQRSGRAGDFFTSVDVGALFGDLLERQVAEMAQLLASEDGPRPGSGPAPREPAGACLDLVEAGAGNGRLSADVLGALRRRHPDIYARTNLHLVETSAAARAVQRATLGVLAERLVSSSDELPRSFEGVLFANELLDAFPVHQVVMRPGGLREVYVDLAPGSPRGRPPVVRLVTREGPPSTPALGQYLDRLGVALEPGWRVEINLLAVEWMRQAASRLKRGFIMLIDYGHDARELYGVTHASGTLATFTRHTMRGAEDPSAAPWLLAPGEQDITAHVDFTSVRTAAEAEGLSTLGFLDQTYFLMGLLDREGEGWTHQLSAANRRALKTLLMPGGLGSTLKVLLLGRSVGTPALRGCSYRARVT